jgi:hypothetical protein
MSRRSRKRKTAGEKRWLGKAVVVSLILGVVILAGGYGLIRNYLHSDSFRKFLSSEASKVANVTGEFSPFRWQGLAVDTESFEATGAGPVTAVRADGLHTEVGLGGLRRGVWEIQGSSLRRLDITLDATKSTGPNKPNRSADPTSRSNSKDRPLSWFPSKAEVQSIDIAEVTVHALLDPGPVRASGMRIRAGRADAKDTYRAEIQGGTIQVPLGIVPNLRLDRVQLRYQDQQVFLTDSNIEAWKNGRISATGEWDSATRRFSAEGTIRDIKCDELLNEDWSKRLTGDVLSDFIIDNPAGTPQARGKLTINNGVVTALPLLDALAAYADTRRFRILTLDEAHTGWRWKKGEIALTDLVLSSDSLVRLEGTLTIREKKLDGVFRLGLAPGTLASIPGAETDVFAPGERGLLWTSLRITGTLDDPKEDLTDRLFAAAGMRMFDQIPETGERVIKFTQSVLGNSSSKTVEKGVKIIEESSKTIREVSGILDGILGGKPKKEDEAQ